MTERRSHPLVAALKELAAVARATVDELRELRAGHDATREGFIEAERDTKAELARLSGLVGDLAKELKETNRLLRGRERQWTDHEERLVRLEVDAATR